LRPLRETLFSPLASNPSETRVASSKLETEGDLDKERDKLGLPLSLIHVAILISGALNVNFHPVNPACPALVHHRRTTAGQSCRNFFSFSRFQIPLFILVLFLRTMIVLIVFLDDVDPMAYIQSAN